MKLKWSAESGLTVRSASLSMPVEALRPEFLISPRKSADLARHSSFANSLKRHSRADRVIRKPNTTRNNSGNDYEGLSS